MCEMSWWEDAIYRPWREAKTGISLKVGVAIKTWRKKREGSSKLINPNLRESKINRTRGACMEITSWWTPTTFVLKGKLKLAGRQATAMILWYFVTCEFVVISLASYDLCFHGVWQYPTSLWLYSVHFLAYVLSFRTWPSKGPTNSGNSFFHASPSLSFLVFEWLKDQATSVSTG